MDGGCHFLQEGGVDATQVGDGKFVRVDGSFCIVVITTTPSTVEVRMVKWRGGISSSGRITVVHCLGAFRLG